MEACSDLEVDVNGQGIFFVDKKIISSFSGKLRNLFGKFVGTKEKLKVIFHDFPGGAECFELIARFCYNNCRINMTPSNIFLLHCAANFMEMNADIHGIPNLINQTEIYLEGIHYWTWSEFMVGLKQCQDLLQHLNSSRVLQEYLNCLVGRFALPYVASPYTSSTDSSSFQFSGDISAESSKNYNPQTTWWFEDLVFLNIELFEKVIMTMVSQKIDHTTICLFIFYYQKSRFLGASPAEKCKLSDTVINLLSLVDRSSIARGGLFYTFRVALNLKVGKCCKIKLESLIGSRLDQATLDDLLVRSPAGKNYAYDVNLILRFLKLFLLENSRHFSLYRLKKAAGLVDLYMAEVAPDPFIKPSKFVALALALPDIARDSHDRMYQAIDLYLEVHCGLCQEEKNRLLCALNYDKLSLVTLKQLAQNTQFPLALLGTGRTALVSRQCKAQKPKVGEKMKTQSLKITKSRLSNPTNARALPRLCP